MYVKFQFVFLLYFELWHALGKVSDVLSKVIIFQIGFALRYKQISKCPCSVPFVHP